MAKVTTIKIGTQEITEVFYPSLSEVYSEIEKYRDRILSPQQTTYRYLNKYMPGFTYYYTFDKALDNLYGGKWQTGTEQLTTKFNLFNKAFEEKARTKTEYDVVGYQASVPRYLMGIPQNMINNKPIKRKEKVITICKHIGFTADITVNEIIDYSARALAIINQIEKSGVRCNLDIISPSYGRGGRIGSIRIRIKNANEKIAPGKLAFSIANPDMFRKIIFALRLTNCYNGNWNIFEGYSGGTNYDRKLNEQIVNQLVPNGYFLNNCIGSIEKEINAIMAQNNK